MSFAVIAMIAKKAGGAVLDRVRERRAQAQYVPPPPPPPKPNYTPLIIGAIGLAAVIYIASQDD